MIIKYIKLQIMQVERVPRPQIHGTIRVYLASMLCLMLWFSTGGLLSASLKPQFGASQDQGVGNSGNVQPQALSNRPTSADLFASLGLSAQFGLFQRPVFDYTKVGVRIDLGTASAVAEKAKLFGYPILNKRDEGSHPTLVLSLQQQVLWPWHLPISSLKENIDGRKLGHKFCQDRFWLSSNVLFYFLPPPGRMGEAQVSTLFFLLSDHSLNTRKDIFCSTELSWTCHFNIHKLFTCSRSLEGQIISPKFRVYVKHPAQYGTDVLKSWGKQPVLPFFILLGYVYWKVYSFNF